MKTVTLKDNVLVIKFKTKDSQEFFSLVSAIKNNISGREWKASMSAWIASPTPQNIMKLRQLGFTVDGEVVNRFASGGGFEEYGEVLTQLEEVLKIERSIDIRSSFDHNFEDVLIDEDELDGFREYQKDGVKFLEQRNGVGIIGDEMGLGKTIQALGYLKIHPEVFPALIVCPASLKLNWAREAMKWLGLDKYDIHMFQSRTAYQLGRTRKLYIINYDILKDWKDIIMQLGIGAVIGDEVQYVSNWKALRTKAFLAISKRAQNRIMLSGTPIKSYPSEFFTILNLIAPGVFPNRWQYLNRYCDPIHNGFGWSYKGITNGDELHDLVSPFMLRREKREVLKELPNKIKSIIPLECDEVELNKYYEASDEFKSWVRENEQRKYMEEKNHVEHLKQLAYLAKRNSAIKWIKDFISTGQKLVVIAIHKKAIQDIKDSFPNISVVVDGSVPLKDKQVAVDSFQNNPKIKIFIGQIIAAGVGLTLTAASSVAFVEFDWVPGNMAQAEDRVHRIGQEADRVNVFYLTAADTIDEDIIRLVQRKSHMVGKVLDGEERDFITQDLMKEYIGEIKNVN